MPVKIRIEHDGAGWAELFSSKAVQGVIDEAGKKIAAEANSGYAREHFFYHQAPTALYARGYIHTDEYTGALMAEKALPKAVHG